MSVAVPKELLLHGRYVSDGAHLLALPDYDTHELAWAAGFFDGEGSTFVWHSQNHRGLYLSVTQSERCCLDRLAHAVGCPGYITYDRGGRPRKQSATWKWRTRNWRDTQRALSLLWPYLSHTKRDQAVLAFSEYQEWVDAHPTVGRRAATGTV